MRLRNTGSRPRQYTKLGRCLIYQNRVKFSYHYRYLASILQISKVLYTIFFTFTALQIDDQIYSLFRFQLEGSKNVAGRDCSAGFPPPPSPQHFIGKRKLDDMLLFFAFCCLAVLQIGCPFFALF
jgi:hypothetical protein